MEKIWTAAFTVAGIGAIAFFVFYSLYKQWLTLRIFQRLSQKQTFTVMVIFLILSFGALIAGVLAWVRSGQTPPTEHALVVPEATRDFFVGRWEVQQKLPGLFEGGSYIDYLENGKISGYQDRFMDGQGQRQKVSGKWHFERVTKNQFSLTVDVEGGSPWQGTFRIIDRDRVHNVEQNYDAIRVMR